MLQRINLLSLWEQFKVVVCYSRRYLGLTVPHTNFSTSFLLLASPTLQLKLLIYAFFFFQGCCGGESAFSHWFLLHWHLGFSFLQLHQAIFDFSIRFPPLEILLNYHVHSCPFSGSLYPLSSTFYCGVLEASRSNAHIQSFIFTQQPLQVGLNLRCLGKCILFMKYVKLP